mgnify:CR=1 FL=1
MYREKIDKFIDAHKTEMLEDIAELCKIDSTKDSYRAGRPYVLFALADNGYEQEAFKMLLTDTCPSWLYEVKAGATTMWERWI